MQVRQLNHILERIRAADSSTATRFYHTFSPSLNPAHLNTLQSLSTLLLPIHVKNDDMAQRFLNEKYVVRMSRSGFSLLIGWLTEGIGGESLGAGNGFSGDRGKRGRSAVMRVVNNHLKFEGECPREREKARFDQYQSHLPALPQFHPLLGRSRRASCPP